MLAAHPRSATRHLRGVAHSRLLTMALLLHAMLQVLLQLFFRLIQSQAQCGVAWTPSSCSWEGCGPEFRVILFVFGLR